QPWAISIEPPTGFPKRNARNFERGCANSPDSAWEACSCTFALQLKWVLIRRFRCHRGYKRVCNGLEEPTCHFLARRFGRRAARIPKKQPTAKNVIPARRQLLQRHQGRKDHVSAQSVIAGCPASQTEYAKSSIPATEPTIRATLIPFLQ